VVGQPRAVKCIADAVRVARAGLHDQGRPLGAFLFLGPTGVGKTELCKALAQQLFDAEDAITRIDMSEYSERHSVSRLVGAPPGYVGYDEGGTLTEAVRRKPYCVLLFDEMEKAHRDVHTLLLSALDEGHLTDSQGKRVSFKNTLMIMTSNLGADALASLPEGQAAESARGKVMEGVRAALPPEFINRLDEIVLFNRLSRSQIAEVTRLELAKATRRLEDQRISLRVTDEALGWLADAGYNPAYGARPVRRAIQQHVVNPLATQLIKLGDVESAHVVIDRPKASEVVRPTTSFWGRPAGTQLPDEDGGESHALEISIEATTASPSDYSSK